MAERKGHLVRLFRYLTPYWKYIFGALLLAVLGALLNLALPWLVEKTIDRALLEKNLRLLVFIALGIVGIFFVKGVASYVQSFWVSLAGFRVITRLRSELYQHLHHLSVAFFQENPPGEIISRMTSDIAVLQNFFSSALVTMLMDLLLFLGSVVFLFFIHWKLALLSIIVFPLVGLCVDILGKRIRGFSHLLQSRVAALTSLVERTVTGIKVIQSYVSGHYEVEKFERENEMNFYLAMKQAKARALFNPLVELVASCGVTAVIWYGGREVIRGFLTPGQLIAFLGYLVIASSPLSRFSSGFQLFQQGLASLERIFEFLDTAPFVTENDEGVELREFRERISFRNVSFSYKGEKILKNFSLDIRKGERVGIVGPSGAGKTTIINLLLRFYDPDEGCIEIDGIDIRKIKLSSLRSLIGVVLQDALVLGGTVRENILYGNLNASEEDIQRASRKARAHEFIMQLEHGYDTDVGEGGCRLSGGQRQRIAIARAFLKNSPILVFDEATSNLDPESERYILETIAQIEEDKTVIIVAHSLRMVKDLDRIVLVADGEVQGEGTHEALLRSHPLYQALFGFEDRALREAR
ncbi:ABC transporter ATP-binding protein [Candidatus Caldatribacterium saccharofermentans]|uniref:ABC transporter ATP-binding protein n=1 Tax=Candidatus Caldatribacterium saccharofermentans TaxID=1454753 RepID=UPI003D001C36